MSQKLQINHLEALERLIGGDTALELDIRQNVAQAFANKHLKGLLEECFRNGEKDFLSKIKKDVADSFKTSLADYISPESAGIFGSDMKLTPAGKALIKNEVRNQIMSVVAEAVKEIEINCHGWIVGQVKHNLNNEILRQIKEGIDTKLKAVKDSL